jgi:S1-C subfamily serine protease
MTGKKLDQCPKCSSKITNEVECESCGIVFEKYFRAEARKEAGAEKAAKETAVSGSRRVAIAVGLALIPIIAAAAFFGLRSTPSADQAGIDRPVIPAGIHTAEESAVPALPITKTATPEKKTIEGDPIQRALRATVSVKTPWGNMGSGFFIGEHDIITNKHVVVFDEAEFAAFKSRVERNRKIIDLEIEKIRDWKTRMSQMPAGPSRSQLEIIIQSREGELERDLPLQRKDEEKLAKWGAQRYSQDIKIITEDNEEYAVDRVMTSATRDLALLKVSAISGQALKRHPEERQLEQGRVVYTIGSPVGLSNTVTSGIFSAYRKMADSEETYLQVDAAINPGNSGGPLIDKQGNVLGVNTMTLTQTEGIGFAIPIAVVFEEFSNSISYDWRSP